MVGLSASRSSTQGVVAAAGKVSLGGVAADVRGDKAQLAVMVSKAIGASRVQWQFGVMGVPRFGLGARRGPDQFQGLLLVIFDPADLADGAFDLEPPGGRIELRRHGARFGRLQTAARPVERIPPKPERMDQDDQGGDSRYSRTGPEGRLRQRRRHAGAHGNTFRSSSKCGPSRNVDQSPPPTMAVPCRTAAALNAAAMRG